MKVQLLTAAVLLSLAGAAHAQTAPTPAPGSDLTRDLNSGPPVPAAYIAPVPATAPASPPPAAVPATTPTPTPAPVITRPVAAPATASPPVATPSAATPRPVAAPSALTPAPARAAAPPASAPAATPPAASPVATPEPASPPPSPGVSTVAVLDAGARAALPFSVTLPAGFEMVTGRPGPDFRIYTIRRGGQSFVMIYAGPASQFPIYSGQMVEAGGRASVVSTEDGVRHAMEHLFQRPDAPREIHVWTMSLDGADRALAEHIAQSVDLH